MTQMAGNAQCEDADISDPQSAHNEIQHANSPFFVQVFHDTLAVSGLARLKRSSSNLIFPLCLKSTGLLKVALSPKDL